MSLRWRLSALVGVAMLPPIGLAAYNSWNFSEVLEREAGDRAFSAAQLVSAEFAQMAETARSVMLVLAKLPGVPDNEQECSANFKAALQDLPVYREAAIIDKTGRFHCSTVPIPPTLDVTDRPYFREPLRTGQFTIGTLTRGRVTGQDSIHLSMPYRSEDGRVEGVIVLILNPEVVALDLAVRPWRSPHRIMVLDREGSLVLGIPSHAGPRLAKVSAEIFGRLKDAPSGIVTAQAGQGDTEIIGYVPLNEAPRGLFIAVAIDRSEALAPVQQSVVHNAIVASLALLAVLAGAWVAVHYLIRKPIMAIVDTARAHESGERVPFPALNPRTELGELSSALSRMSAHVEQLLEQKTFLLRELQHRVMNSLTLLASVVGMQKRLTADRSAQEQLGSVQRRIYSMATVYRHIYQSDSTDNVDFSELLRTVCEESRRAYASEGLLSIDLVSEPVPMRLADAGALAMLTHELITNAIKHAYGEGELREIKVRLSRAGEYGLELAVADRGRGIPTDFELERSGSLGGRVVAGTVRQLNGSIEIRRLDPGTEFIIRLPDTPAMQPAAEQAEPDSATVRARAAE